MKKFTALFLALAMLICCAVPALADGREKPEDKKVITTDDVIGAETVFKKYDNKFYDAPSEQPGTVVRLDYTTTAYGVEQPGWVNVYLPYGYDENGTERYNVIYFLHGTNETQDSYIGDEKAKNALDNMIEVGVTANLVNGQLMPSTELLPRWKHTKPEAQTTPASGFGSEREELFPTILHTCAFVVSYMEM